MNVSGIPFLTEISNKSAESIRGGYIFRAIDIDGNLVTQGSITPEAGAQGVTRATIAAGTNTFILRSALTGGSFLITFPGEEPRRFSPPEGGTFVRLGRGDFGNIAGTGTEFIVQDLGLEPVPGTCSAAEDPGCSRPDASGGGGGSSLTFFPSS